MCVFSLQTLSETFFFVRRTERDGHKCILVFTYSTRYSCHILIELIFQQILERFSDIKFNENTLVRNRVRQADIHGVANIHFSRLC
jgi:hypothetical protein